MRRTAGRHTRKGIALIAALIFIAVFMAASAGMLAMSSQNSIAASNLHTANLTRSTAESGLELVRYWTKDIVIPAWTHPDDRYDYFLDELQDALVAAGITPAPVPDENGVLEIGSAQYPIVIEHDASRHLNRTFHTQIYEGTLADGRVCIVVDIEGVVERSQTGLSRRLRSAFSYGTRPNSIFDYGVATKGPLHLIGNTSLEGYAIASDSDVFIDTAKSSDVLSVGNSAKIAGNVSIVNPDTYISPSDIKGEIGGLDGTNAIENIDIGVEPTEFPVPNPGYFEQYLGTETIDSTNLDSYLSSSDPLVNVRIEGGTGTEDNPLQLDSKTIKGVLYIEQPNVVNFAGNTTVTGIIVGNGYMDDHSGDNQMNFTGTVESHSVSTLPAEYGDLRSETGTFLMAPGFSASFGGNFGTVNGAIFANGVEFYGNAGGTIEGSVINYSPTPMTVEGSSSITFNRTGVTEIPAGFEQEILVHFLPASYTEVASGF